ncbi:40187_t:CDS:2, partial [Gigaspora margarita]
GKQINYKFNHELPKDKNSLAGKVSTPLCVAQLLTELLEIEKAKGKIVYDECIGVGALASFVDTYVLLYYYPANSYDQA